ncbi:MAG: segregation/condensation protein A, partial [Taibaiella sp.]|nr:segregation/condensation protein A [Taibaiella sp.]
MSAYDYKIKLPEFEGPFDLLLFFIERDEVDIYNIPIHRVTQDFLDYIHQAEQLNIELASDFILFISNLMRIKAKMLLPRRELDAAGNEIDPRQELVDKILEYKRYKEAAAAMATLEAERLLQAKRGNIEKELEEIGKQNAEGSELQHVTMYKLMQSFEKALKKLEERNNKPQHIVVKYNYSMESQRTFLMNYFQHHDKLAFEKLLESSTDRIHIIFTFLSILELIQQGFINV